MLVVIPFESQQRLPMCGSGMRRSPRRPAGATARRERFSQRIFWRGTGSDVVVLTAAGSKVVLLREPGHSGQQLWGCCRPGDGDRPLLGQNRLARFGLRGRMESGVAERVPGPSDEIIPPGMVGGGFVAPAERSILRLLATCIDLRAPLPAEVRRLKRRRLQPRLRP